MNTFLISLENFNILKRKKDCIQTNEIIEQHC